MGDNEAWEAQAPTFVGDMRSREKAAVPAVAETLDELHIDLVTARGC